MTFRRKILLTSCLLSLCVGLVDTKAHAETLESAVSDALGAHPSVEAAIAALDATKEQRREAHSGYFPTVSVNASAGRMYGDNATSRGLTVTRGAGYSNFGEGSVTLSQPIFDGFRTSGRIDAAQSRQNAASMNIADIRESLALRAVQSYIDVIRTRKAVDMIAAHTLVVADYLARISDMVEEGASDEAELQQARDVSLVLQSIRSEYDAQKSASETRYFEVTGRMPVANLAEPPSLSGQVPENIEQVVSYSMNAHPAVLSAGHGTRAASHDIGVEKAALYPSINGELSYLKSDKRDVLGGEIEDARALVRLSWNFATGGEQFARIRRTEASVTESKARSEALKRQIEQDIRLAYNEFYNSARQLQIARDRRELNEKLFAAYEAQFEGARVNLLQLMQSHNQMFNTYLEVLNATYRHIGSQYGVMASAGRLQEVMAISGTARAAPVSVVLPQQ